VRAQCERTAVEPCRATFGRAGDFGSVTPILSVGVSWRRAIGWVCKPEVTESFSAGGAWMSRTERSWTRQVGFVERPLLAASDRVKSPPYDQDDGKGHEGDRESHEDPRQAD
jgi:hypothetical protein